jgi:hypothetical protein
MAGRPVMRIRALILWFSTVVALTTSLAGTVRADAAPSREYSLKAAFLHSFMMFVDGGRFHWESSPKRPTDPNERIQIGIVGQSPFGDAFKPLRNRTVRDRFVVIKQFKGLSELTDEDGRIPKEHPQIEAIRQCHMLFICASEKPYIKPILSPIRTLGILTVADTPGFLEAGGMINFVIEDKKVRFEINTAAAARAHLQIRAKLLRLAQRVITHDAIEEHNGEGKETQSADR